MQDHPLKTNLLPRSIDRWTQACVDMSDRIWGMPELRFEETRSVEEQITLLQDAGFAITRNLAGMPTAFMAESGGGEVTVAFLGEFDALATLSQEAGVTEPRPLVEGGNGHGCGHNLLGGASVLAAIALRDALAAAGMPGRVRYYGCPAEEGGSGKTYMVKAGAFDGVDAAFCWHPCVYNAVMSSATLANTQAYFRFTGKAAHAAMAPEVGRSALDALELMNIGINFMREHMISDARIHYSITNAGGISPNIVQPEAEGLYLIRAPKSEDVRALYERVERIAKGAAMMTDTTVSIEFDRATSEVLPNRVLEARMHANMSRIGAPPFDAADQAFGKRLQDASLTKADKQASARSFGGPADFPRAFHDEILPFPAQSGLLLGSTDVGDVSQIIPTAQCLTATHCIGTPFHTWQTVTQGKLPSAHKAMVLAAHVMAATAADVIIDEALLLQARDELATRRNAEPYVSPVPDGVSPPTSSRRGTPAAALPAGRLQATANARAGQA